MIDLHCHLLPGIDDGPENLAQAIDLARIAVSNGIEKAVLTPHVHPGRYENRLDNISEAVESFGAKLQELNIPLQLGVGGEVRISAEILLMVKQNQIPFVGEMEGKKVMLLELPHGHIPPGTDKMIDWLRLEGIVAMIAHPERNKELLRQPDKICVFLQKGCLLQVTADSVAGKFGPQVKECADYFLENEWVHILASDAHNREHRPPNLESGRAAAEKIVGEVASWEMVRERPWRLAEGHFS